jgi:aminomethyltransferase
VNAACKQNDYKYLLSNLQNDCKIDLLADHALLAIQGPCSRKVMGRIVPAIAELPYMQAMYVEISSIRCLVSCSGYTGEDGFEISIPSPYAKDLAKLLLDQEEVLPIGLGARDTLRLEAGICLYGHDLRLDTTPVEANLAWVISRARRPEGKRPNGCFGAGKIVKQLVSGTNQIRIGILPEGKALIREGTLLMDEKGSEIGCVISGNYSPVLQQPIAIAYVDSSIINSEKHLFAYVRDRHLPVSISKLPFVPKNYYSPTI